VSAFTQVKTVFSTLIIAILVGGLIIASFIASAIVGVVITSLAVAGFLSFANHERKRLKERSSFDHIQQKKINH